MGSAPVSDMAALRTDLSYAFRLMRKSPGFSALAIGSLALGIAANVVIFSIVNGVLLKPLDFPHPENLYTIEEIIPKIANLYPTLPANPRHADQWKRTVPAIAQLGLGQSQNVVLGGETGAVRVGAERVTPSFLTTLGVRPLLGRLIDETDVQAGHDPVVLLSYGLWQSRFGGAPDIVGRQIQINGAPETVVGVLPESFHCPPLGPHFTSAEVQIFRPLALRVQEFSLLGDFNFGAIARLKAGVSLETATAQLNTSMASLAKTFPEKVDVRATLLPLNAYLVKDSRKGLLVLLSAVGAVLLIVCLNLAALMLARSVLRSQEMAIRAAVGANRWRLMRQSLTEAMLYAIVGGAIGTWLAGAGLQLILAAAPDTLPRRNDVAIDLPVLLFALGVAIFTAFLFGLYPAWQQSRRDPQEALLGSSRSLTASRTSARGRRLLIVFEVGLSTTLLVAAALLANSFVRLVNVDAGFRAGQGVSAQLTLPGVTYRDPKVSESFYEKLLTTLTAQPGISHVGLTSHLPLEGETWMDGISRPGEAQSLAKPSTNVRFVSGSYFETMGIPILAGRSFEDANHQRGDLALISSRVAREFWPRENPIGQKLAVGDTTVQVVGIAGDALTDINKSAPSMVYLPYWSTKGINQTDITVVLRSQMPVSDAVRVLRRTVASINRGVPVSQVRTFGQLVSGAVAQQQFQMILIGIFALAALAVAALGIFGVVAGVVAARRSEIGIRMALGATRAGVLRTIVRQGMVPVCAGLLAGLLGALAAGPILRSFLYEVSPSDPSTLSAVVVLLAAVAALACWIPARRAARIDPIEALRYQ
jgi:predicted permease